MRRTIITVEYIQIPSQPPEFWSFISASLLVFVFGGILTTISFVAYRREQKRSLQGASLGFLFVTVSGLVGVVYQVFIERSYYLGGVELLRLQTIEAMLLALGFLTLLYSVYQY
jgi:hypothetical protein